MSAEEQVDFEEDAEEELGAEKSLRTKGRGFRKSTEDNGTDRGGIYEGIHQEPGSGPAKCKLYIFEFRRTLHFYFDDQIFFYIL
jgi:hypothetical protein